VHATQPSGELGILGGTFNPPHLGHIALARAAADQLGLECVLLTPARVAPHKQCVQDPRIEHRLHMCRLAAACDSRLDVCTLELDRPGPSFTVDTLRRLDADHPGTQMTLIMGADMARTLSCWREPLEILRLARLAVAERDAQRRESVLEALEPLDGAARTAFIDMQPVDVSSSIVRARASMGEPIDKLVGAEVAAYIVEHGLYRTSPTIAESERPR
jgi:nicotinate-nucleotide adenylyltransferase